MAMGLVLQVPESVAQAIRLPEKHMQEGLLLELAVALYAREVLPFGKARELAGATRREFALALGQRGVARHYGKEEIEDDLIYARSQ
jgi:predicted HTH domain antitoxin